VGGSGDTVSGPRRARPAETVAARRGIQPHADRFGRGDGCRGSRLGDGARCRRRLLVYDADTSRARRGRRQRCRPARDAALAAASAYAQFATADAGAGALVVTIDRSGASPSLRAAMQTASGLPGAPPFRPHGPHERGGPRHAPYRDAGTADDTRRPSAASARRESVALLHVLADPSVLTAPERAAILQLIGNGGAATTEAADAAYTDHRAQTRDTLGAVAITPPSDITLAASSAPLTFSVRNDLPGRSPSSSRDTQRPAPRRAERRPRRSGPVAEHPRAGARAGAVGSGESTLDLQLRSATGVRSATGARAVSVRAEWESVGSSSCRCSSARSSSSASSARREMRRRPPRRPRPARRQRTSMANLGRASAIIGAGTLFSRHGTGALARARRRDRLVRQPAADAFSIAAQLPTNVYELLAAGVITGILVPQIVKAAAHSDGGSRYVSKLLTLGASCSSPPQPS
jgi:hypothetical protein